MDKREAEQRAQELIDFYGSGAYKGPQKVDMGDGRIGVRMIATWPGFVPSIKDMTMSEQNTERDTHFQGAAELLETDLAEMLDIYFDSPAATEEQIRAATRLRIAQFLFDFKQHVMNHVDDYELEESYIPDMTELPE